MTILTVTPGAELPDRAITWTDGNGAVIDFSGYTFRLAVAFPTPVSKTGGITGAATAPNVTVSFTGDETADWPAGIYDAQLWPKRTADGKDREPLSLGVFVQTAL